MARDTRAFAIQRWEDAVLAVQQTQSITGKYHLSLCGVSRREQMEAKALCIDWDIVAGPWDWQAVLKEIQKRGTEREATGVTKRLLNHLQPLPRSLNNLVNTFTSAVQPAVPRFNVLWGLLYLNIKARLCSVDDYSSCVNI